TLVLLLVVTVAAVGWFGRDVWRRLWQFLRRWHEEDRILEEAQKAQQVYRKQAEQEVADCLHETPSPTTLEGCGRETMEAMPDPTPCQATEAVRQNTAQKQGK